MANQNLKLKQGMHDIFNFKRKICNEASYADVFYTSQKFSPFSNKFKWILLKTKVDGLLI